MRKALLIVFLTSLVGVNTAFAQFGGGNFGGGIGGGGAADNLGNHTATQNLILGTNRVVGDSSAGICLDPGALGTCGTNFPAAGGVAITGVDGSNALVIPNNTTFTCSSGNQLYPEGNLWKACENGSEYSIILDKFYFKSPDAGDCDALNQYEDECHDTTLKGNVYYDENGSIQWVGSKKIKHYRFSVQDPENLNTHAARSTKSVVLPPFDDSYGAVITKIIAHSDTDDYAFNLFACGSATDCGTTNDVLIDLVTCSTNGTSTFYDIQTTISSATVAAALPIIFEHSSGAAETVAVDIYYYLNGNVD